MGYYPKIRTGLGLDFYVYRYSMDNIMIKLQIWDAMEEIDGNLQELLIRNTVGIFLMFDITRRDTFEKLDHYKEQLIRRCEKRISFILVGSMQDRDSDRQVSLSEIKEYCLKNSLGYVEISGKENTNIDTALSMMAQEILINNDFSTLNNKTISKENREKRGIFTKIFDVFSKLFTFLY